MNREEFIRKTKKLGFSINIPGKVALGHRRMK